MNLKDQLIDIFKDVTPDNIQTAAETYNTVRDQYSNSSAVNVVRVTRLNMITHNIEGNAF